MAKSNLRILIEKKTRVECKKKTQTDFFFFFSFSLPFFVSNRNRYLFSFKTPVYSFFFILRINMSVDESPQTN